MVDFAWVLFANRFTRDARIIFLSRLFVITVRYLGCRIIQREIHSANYAHQVLLRFLIVTTYTPSLLTFIRNMLLAKCADTPANVAHSSYAHVAYIFGRRPSVLMKWSFSTGSHDDRPCVQKCAAAAAARERCRQHAVSADNVFGWCYMPSNYDWAHVAAAAAHLGDLLTWWRCNCEWECIGMLFLDAVWTDRSIRVYVRKWDYTRIYISPEINTRVHVSWECIVHTPTKPTQIVRNAKVLGSGMGKRLYVELNETIICYQSIINEYSWKFMFIKFILIIYYRYCNTSYRHCAHW